MNRKRHFFKPDQVDDQVDQFSLPAPRALIQKQAQESEQQDGQDAHVSEQDDSRQDVSTQLVQELQAYYQSERQQNQDFLEHAWWRIVAHQSAKHATPQAGKAVSSTPPLRFSPERIALMQDQNSRGKRFARSVSMFAASLVAVVLVGTLIATLALSHNTSQKNAVGSGKTPTPTPTATATPVPEGSVVHTQQSPAGMRSYNLAWSLDSSRVATLSDDSSGRNAQVQIWDATTGGDVLTIPFATTWSDVSWSPTGKYLALTNLQEIVIVNAQTGAVVNTLKNDAYVAPSARVTGTGTVPLASFMPNGGGYGFFGSAWASDDATMAVTISYFTSTKVELLDPLTGAVKTTLTSPSGQLGGLSFSSDGQYLLASEEQQLVVWRLSSKSIVYQQNLDEGDNVAWQPGTHNLAVSFLFPAKVQLWNIDTHKLVTTYAGINIFAWSPDGKELAGRGSVPPGLSPTRQATSAAASGSAQVTIIDAASGATVATYTGSAASVSNINWSPDGHYIATLEFDGSNSSVVRVWVA